MNEVDKQGLEELFNEILADLEHLETACICNTSSIADKDLEVIDHEDLEEMKKVIQEYRKRFNDLMSE